MADLKGIAGEGLCRAWDDAQQAQCEESECRRVQIRSSFENRLRLYAL